MQLLRHRASFGVALALICALAASSLLLVQTAKADVDPAGCSSTGGSIILTTYRADGTTPIGGGTVSDGELIKYKATLGSLPAPVCAYQGGTWSLTTPDGVVHDITPGGGVPKIGGAGVASLDSMLVSYTVIHANEIVSSNRHVDASTLYSGGISHKNVDDSLAGPTLGTSEQTIVIHTPVVATNIHNAAHAVITDAPIGSTVHDNATVTGAVGGPAPTGFVAFNLYPNSSCSGATSSAEVVALSGNTEASGTVVPNTGLSYMAYYNGDSNYTAAAGICEPLTATKLSPIVVTDIHNDTTHAVVLSVDAGTSVHDKATVGGNGVIPVTGNVEFSWFTNGTCDAQAGPVVAAGTIVLDGSGIAHPSTTEGPLAAGSYSFKAHYVGDANYNAADAQCEPLTVNKLTPTVVTDIHDAAHAIVTSVVSGTTVHDKATVSGSGPTPTGTVDFTWFTNGTCSAGAVASGAGIALVAGVAEPSSTQTPVSAGGYSFMAHYNGDGTYSAADGACEPLTVTAKGHIVVDKVTIPAADPQLFAFTTSGTGYSGFALTDAAAPNDQELDAGAYSVAETAVAGWTQTSAICTSSLGGSENPASIGLTAGETVTCTFTNTKNAVQGCSPGYWKQSQHFGSYPTPTTYPSSLFSSVGFEDAFPGKSLVEVLSTGGGGLTALGRIIVGAYLNASSVNGFPYTPAQVVADFNSVFPGGNYDALKAKYEALQDPCPLGLNPGPAYAGGPTEGPGKKK